MKYTTRMTKENNSVLTFNEILHAAKELSPNPIERIEVGLEFYEELLESAKKSVHPDHIKKVKYLGSLYGVKIMIDPELKEREYKIVPPQS